MPVTLWRDMDEAWLNIAQGLRLVIEQFMKSPVESIVSSSPTSTRRTSSITYPLYEVFLKSGVPGITFVEPEEFNELKMSLAQPGRGVVIEGPTGIGKTTALKKAVEQLQSSKGLNNNSNYIEILSARVKHDIQKIKTITSWHQGAIAIEDFHRLDTSSREELIDYLKYLADTEPISKKLVIVGIPNCGQTLVQSSFDIAMRFDVFQFGKVKTELIIKMIEQGEQALNILFDKKADIALAASGSLNIAQFLCFKICQRENILETQSKTVTVNCDIDEAVSRVMIDLSRKFEEPLRRFVALGGRRDSTCLELLEELKRREDGFLPLMHLQDSRPEFASKIGKFISEDWMKKLYNECPDFQNYLFFDSSITSLVVDDPQFTFFLGRMSFSKLSKEAGKSAVEAREQVFISYSRRDAEWLRMLQIHLKPLIRKGTLAIWSDTNISSGAKWRNEIERALASAKVAVLLVSPHFLASDFIVDNELPPLLESAEKDGLKVIWIPVSASLYTETEIERYQAAINPSNPLDSLSSAQLNAVFVQIVQEIKQAATLS